MEMNTSNKLVINGNQTVQTVFNTKNKNAHLTALPNLELKQTTIYPGNLTDIYSTSRCINMRTIASCTWLMKPEAMVMAIAEINLDLKKFVNGLPATDYA